MTSLSSVNNFENNGCPHISKQVAEQVNTQNANNALRLVNCMKNMGSSTTLRLRSEEDQTQENYFCRIKAAEYNFSANPTFVTGSKNKIRTPELISRL